MVTVQGPYGVWRTQKIVMGRKNLEAQMLFLRSGSRDTRRRWAATMLSSLDVPKDLGGGLIPEGFHAQGATLASDFVL